MGNIHVKLYEVWTSGLGGDVIKDISYLELWLPLCSEERNHLCNFLEGIMRNNTVKLF